MRTAIYYFSGTGNSLVAARDLAAALGDADVIPIPRAMRQAAPVTANRVGFVFPVYAWGLPLIVAEFCRRLEAKPGPYLFAVATCGGSVGATHRQLAALLRARGLTLASSFVLVMPGNYTPLCGAPRHARQQKLFAREKQAIPAIAEFVRAGRTCPPKVGHPITNALGSALYRWWAPELHGSDQSFRATDRCDGCEVCRKVCPVGNIVIRDGRPVWQHHCEQCMACLQWCPPEAIQYGRGTERRRRYRHPEVRARDFMLFEAQG
jgi:ferredoxin